MEPPAKRQRVDFRFNNLSSPPHHTPIHGYGQVIEEDEEDQEVIDDDFDDDFEADEALQTQRARLDYKLKSTFEGIFEKYGKDFDSIGDEIDLNTGRILVNNGHLIQMQHERDAGDAEPYTSSSDDSGGGSEDEGMDSEVIWDEMEVGGEEEDEQDEQDDYEVEAEEEEEEEEEEEDDDLSDGDMMEDDLILRGFSQASRFIHQKRPSKRRLSTDNVMEVLEEPQQFPASRGPGPASVLPTCAEILSQFGPQLGPEIVKYVKKKGVLDDISIEPAWRVPSVAPSRTEKHHTPRPAIRNVESERPPSPGYSVWATNNKPARSRANFTEDEDALLLGFVAEVRQQGLDLWAHQTWKILATKHPQHNYIVWKNRYRLKHRRLHIADSAEDTQSSSETSTISAPLPATTRLLHNEISNNRLPSPEATLNIVAAMHPAWPLRQNFMSKQAPLINTTQRPTRERKPVQRPSTFLDWSEALATIKSVDPALHSSLLQDVQRVDPDAVSRYAKILPSTPSYEKVKVQLTSTIKTPRRLAQEKLGRPVDDESDEAVDHTAHKTRHSDILPRTKICTQGDCTCSSKAHRIRRPSTDEMSSSCLRRFGAHQDPPYPCQESPCDCTGQRGLSRQEDLVRHVCITHQSPKTLVRLRHHVSPSYLDGDYSTTNSTMSTTMSLPAIPVVETDSVPGVEAHSKKQYQAIDIPLGLQYRQDMCKPKGHELHSKPRENHDRFVDISSPSRSITNSDRLQPEAKEKRSVPACLLESRKNPVSQGVSRSYCLPQSISDKPMKPAVRNLQRNTVDPSYEFSDEENRLPDNEPVQSNKTSSAKTDSRAPKNHSFKRKTNELHAAELSSTTTQIKDEAINENLTGSHVTACINLEVAEETAVESSMKRPNRQNAGGLQKLSRNSKQTINDLNPGLFSGVSLDQEATQKSSLKQQADVKIESTDRPDRVGKLASLVRKASFTTPAKSKEKPRKSILKNIAYSDEVDELSPCADDFVYLYSRPRSGTLQGSRTEGCLKHEDIVNEPNSVSKRKRKAASLVEDDESDELGSNETASLLSSTKKPKQSPIRSRTNKSSKNAQGVENRDIALADKSHSSDPSMKSDVSVNERFPSSPPRWSRT